MIVPELSWGAKQLGWTSCLTTADTITLGPFHLISTPPPPMDEVFCLENPQKITFTQDPSGISMD